MSSSYVAVEKNHTVKFEDVFEFGTSKRVNVLAGKCGMIKWGSVG